MLDTDGTDRVRASRHRTYGLTEEQLAFAPERIGPGRGDLWLSVAQD